MSSLTHGLLVVLCLGQAMAYIQRIFEQDMVCSILFHSSNVELIGREDQSALVIKDNNYFNTFSGNQEFKCKFAVSSTVGGLGVFAVIQQMSFRRNAQGKCIDYIQFRHSEKPLNVFDLDFKIKSSEGWTDPICGDINVLETNDDNESNQGSDKNEDKEIKNSFIDNKGNIEVKIYLGNKSVESNEELKLEIVFTAFQECKFNNGYWRQCSKKTCIFKDFMDDDKRNCPYKNCKESVCHFSADGNYLNSTFGTKVMAGTVACLLTMFVVFIAFLWVFRHCGTAFCCMGSPNSHPHSSEMQPVPNLDTMVIIASAPPSTLVASGTEIRTADKDLPPSYDSLFPSK